MTEPLDLDEIKARAEAATGGPWRVNEFLEVWADRDPAGWDAFFIAATKRDSSDRTDEDAQFIAHARSDVPALIAEVYRLRSQLAVVASIARDINSIIGAPA